MCWSGVCHQVQLMKKAWEEDRTLLWPLWHIGRTVLQKYGLEGRLFFEWDKDVWCHHDCLVCKWMEWWKRLRQEYVSCCLKAYTCTVPPFIITVQARWPMDRVCWPVWRLGCGPVRVGVQPCVVAGVSTVESAWATTSAHVHRVMWAITVNTVMLSDPSYSTVIVVYYLPFFRKG